MKYLVALIIFSSTMFGQYRGGQGDGFSSNASQTGWASEKTSQISANADTIKITGPDTVLITVVLKDVSGTQLIAGGDSVAVTASTGVVSPVIDNADGTYSAMLTSITIDTGTISVNGWVNGSQLNETVNIYVNKHVPVPSLLFIKTASKDTIAHPDTVVYKLKVVNTGETVQTGIVLTDTISSAFAIITTTPSATVTGNVVTYSNTSLGIGVSDSLLITVRTLSDVGSNTSIVNKGYINTTDTSGSSAVTITQKHVPVPSLLFIKTASKDTIAHPDTVVYKLKVVNTGETVQTGIVLTDTISSAFAIITTTPSATVTGNVVTYSNTSLGIGVSDSLLITVRTLSDVGSDTSIVNKGYINTTDTSGSSAVTITQKPNSGVAVEDKNADIRPDRYSLSQNYPNPFNPTTTITYDIPLAGNVSLKIYNFLGQEVVTLINGMHSRGRYTVVWNGRDGSGKTVSSGIYFYQLRSSEGPVFTKKMILMK